MASTTGKKQRKAYTGKGGMVGDPYEVEFSCPRGHKIRQIFVRTASAYLPPGVRCKEHLTSWAPLTSRKCLPRSRH